MSLTTLILSNAAPDLAVTVALGTVIAIPFRLKRARALVGVLQSSQAATSRRAA